MSFWDKIASPFKSVGKAIYNTGKGFVNGVKGIVNFGASTTKKIIEHLFIISKLKILMLLNHL